MLFSVQLEQGNADPEYVRSAPDQLLDNTNKARGSRTKPHRLVVAVSETENTQGSYLQGYCLDCLDGLLTRQSRGLAFDDFFPCLICRDH